VKQGPNRAQALLTSNHLGDTFRIGVDVVNLPRKSKDSVALEKVKDSCLCPQVLLAWPSSVAAFRDSDKLVGHLCVIQCLV
jgi:hypothetical protein